jgi:hypothetical protein
MNFSFKPKQKPKMKQGEQQTPMMPTGAKPVPKPAMPMEQKPLQPVKFEKPKTTLKPVTFEKPQQPQQPKQPKQKSYEKAISGWEKEDGKFLGYQPGYETHPAYAGYQKTNALLKNKDLTAQQLIDFQADMDKEGVDHPDIYEPIMVKLDEMANAGDKTALQYLKNTGGLTKEQQAILDQTETDQVFDEALQEKVEPQQQEINPEVNPLWKVLDGQVGIKQLLAVDEKNIEGIFPNGNQFLLTDNGSDLVLKVMEPNGGPVIREDVIQYEDVDVLMDEMDSYTNLPTQVARQGEGEGETETMDDASTQAFIEQNQNELQQLAQLFDVEDMNVIVEKLPQLMSILKKIK